MFAAILGKGLFIYQEEEKVHKKPGALQNEKLRHTRFFLIFMLIAVTAPGIAAVTVKIKKR
ncbi:MAG: hypothetical protein HFF06_02055 [Oscillospiraceae bacterium]|nr:hypothetical protein [Oscillospiraceae bacterium]